MPIVLAPVIRLQLPQPQLPYSSTTERQELACGFQHSGKAWNAVQEAVQRWSLGQWEEITLIAKAIEGARGLTYGAVPGRTERHRRAQTETWKELMPAHGTAMWELVYRCMTWALSATGKRATCLAVQAMDDYTYPWTLWSPGRGGSP